MPPALADRFFPTSATWEPNLNIFIKYAAKAMRIEKVTKSVASVGGLPVATTVREGLVQPKREQRPRAEIGLRVFFFLTDFYSS